MNRATIISLLTAFLATFAPAQLGSVPGIVYGQAPKGGYRTLNVKTEQLESGIQATVFPNACKGDDVSIAVDKNNCPHLTYKNTDSNLELAEFINGKWRAINLMPDNWESSGMSNSIVIDAGGFLHVGSTYKDFNGERLLHFTDKGGWNHSVADNVNRSVGLKNDMAIDSKGKVHMSHYQWGGSFDYGRVLYSTNRNGNWETLVLDEDAGWGRQTSIAIGNQDDICISYASDRLAVFSNRTGKWSLGHFPSTISNINDMAAGPYNTLHVVGRGARNEDFLDGLAYATNVNGWQMQPISEETFRFMNTKWFNDPSIALDSNGNVHIVTTASDWSAFGRNVTQYNNSLYYFTNALRGWQEFILDRGLACDRADIAVDNKGEVHVVWSEERYEHWEEPHDYIMNLKYATFDPSQLSLPDRLLTGLCYVPHKDTSSANREHIQEDLFLVSQLTPYIRTYGIDGDLSNLPELCYPRGLRCFVGIPLTLTSFAKGRATEDAIKIAGRKYLNVDAIVIGDEPVTRHGLTPIEVVSCIKAVRERMDRDSLYTPGTFLADKLPKLTTSETWEIWEAYPALAESVDIIMLDMHPYEDGKSLEEALTYVHTKFDEVCAAYHHKDVVISEIGWPSEGNPFGNYASSPADQTRFFQGLRDLAQREKIPYLYFEAFDEPSTGGFGRRAREHYGLFDVNDVPKESLRAILPAGLN